MDFCLKEITFISRMPLSKREMEFKIKAYFLLNIKLYIYF